jgi:ribosomal protein S18 acetylase RimI-like enzyme
VSQHIPGTRFCPAIAQDAPRAAELILAAAPNLSALCGGRDIALRVAAEAFRKRDSIFGLNYAEIAIDDAVHQTMDRDVAGLIAALPATAWRESTDRLGSVFMRVLGWRLVGLLPTMLAMRNFSVAPPRGSVYISVVAVRPDARGKGVGSALLHRVIERAWQAGHSAVTLDVDVGNPRAQELYIRFGFEPVTRRPVPERLVKRMGSAGFERMELRRPG